MDQHGVLLELENHLYYSTGEASIYPYAGSQFVAGLLDTIFTTSQCKELVSVLHDEPLLMVYDYTNGANTKRAVVSCPDANASEIILTVDGQLSWTGISTFAKEHPDTTIIIRSVTRANYPRITPRGARTVNGEHVYNSPEKPVPIWRRAAYSIFTSILRK